MTVFGRYADWYDLFYADKDYRAESAFVDRMLRQHGVMGGNLLEIGCGTGAHAQCLLNSGWSICGIDRSPQMLTRARERFATARPGNLPEVEFHQGDARGFDLGRQFDAAVSLFHVMSYQAEAGDLEAAMKAARRHLRRDGLFLFDFWYGPAVLATMPESRVRLVEDQRYRVQRTATPTLYDDQRVVDVRYDFSIVDKIDGSRTELEETHRMRYLFPDEVTELAARTGFRVEEMLEWLTDTAPDEGSWNACAVLRAGTMADEPVAR